MLAVMAPAMMPALCRILLHLWQRSAEYCVEALQSGAVKKGCVIIDPSFLLPHSSGVLFLFRGCGGSGSRRLDSYHIEAVQHFSRVPFCVALDTLPYLLDWILR